jgi:hypothetical protein
MLDAGATPSFTVPTAVRILSLSAGALLRTYESPSIATLLDTTGRLVEGAARRLDDTGRWVLTATLPGGLRPGTPGIVATVQVRMLHAHMRRLARLRGYDEQAHGAPINQIDLARTWLDFTLVTMRAEESLGFDLTADEVTAVYRYWAALAHQLGIDPGLVGGITGHDQAAELDVLLQAVTGPLGEKSRALSAALVEAIAASLEELLRIPQPVGSRLIRSLGRRFHGSVIADQLDLRSPVLLDLAISATAVALRTHRWYRRRDAAAWERTRTANIAAGRELLGGPEDDVLYEAYRDEHRPVAS